MEFLSERTTNYYFLDYLFSSTNWKIAVNNLLGRLVKRGA